MKEISDYLGRIKAWQILLGGLVIIVMMAVGFAMSPPSTVLRTVAVVGPDRYANSANDRVDFIRNLQAAAETTSVLDTVSLESGLTPAQVADRLKVERIESSNLVRITYESPNSDPTVAKTVVLTLLDSASGFLRVSKIEEASTLLGLAQDNVAAAEADVAAAEADVAAAEADVAAAEADVAAAEADIAAAEADIAKAIAKNSNIQPDIAFKALQSELVSLRIKRASIDALDSPVVAEQLTTAITDLEAELPTAAVRAKNFATLVADKEALVRAQQVALVAVARAESAVTRAESALNDAEQVAADAERSVAEAETEYDLTTAPPEVSLEVVEQEVSQVLPWIRRSVAMGVAGLVLVVAGLFAWNILADRKDPPSLEVDDANS